VCSIEGRAQDASELQTQIEAQRAENQALKNKIEQFERVLKTDVCKNPEAAKLLDEEPPAAPPPEPATPQSK
jgi:cell division protein FtsB